ncbi:MAG: hypothetical protein V4609_08165 [Pseudomonadota bacterium]
MIARLHSPRRFCRAGTLLGRAVIWFVLLATLASVASAVFQQLPAALAQTSNGTDWATVGLLAGGTAIVFAVCQALTWPARNETERIGDTGEASDLGDGA